MRHRPAAEIEVVDGTLVALPVPAPTTSPGVTSLVPDVAAMLREADERARGILGLQALYARLDAGRAHAEEARLGRQAAREASEVRWRAEVRQAERHAATEVEAAVRERRRAEAEVDAAIIRMRAQAEFDAGELARDATRARREEATAAANAKRVEVVEAADAMHTIAKREALFVPMIEAEIERLKRGEPLQPVAESEAEGARRETNERLSGIYEGPTDRVRHEVSFQAYLIEMEKTQAELFGPETARRLMNDIRSRLGLDAIPDINELIKEEEP